MDLILAIDVFVDSNLSELQLAIETQLVQNMRLLHPDLASDLLYKLA